MIWGNNTSVNYSFVNYLNSYNYNSISFRAINTDFFRLLSSLEYPLPSKFHHFNYGKIYFSDIFHPKWKHHRQERHSHSKGWFLSNSWYDELWWKSSSGLETFVWLMNETLELLVCVKNLALFTHSQQSSTNICHAIFVYIVINVKNK